MYRWLWILPLVLVLGFAGCADSGGGHHRKKDDPEGPTGEIAITIQRPANAQAPIREVIDPATEWFLIKLTESMGAELFAEIPMPMGPDPVTTTISVPVGTYSVEALGLRDTAGETNQGFAFLLTYGITTNVLVSAGATTQATITMAATSGSISSPNPVYWNSAPSLTLTITNYPASIKSGGLVYYHVDSGSWAVACWGLSGPTSEPMTYSCTSTTLPGAGSSIEFGAAMFDSPYVCGGCSFHTLSNGLRISASPVSFANPSGSIGIVLQ